MDIIKGSIVRAKAGRDKGGYFVVTDICDEKRVMICDGKRRKVTSPKCKNIIHLEPTSVVLNEFTTNRQIKNYLKSFMEEKHV